MTVVTPLAAFAESGHLDEANKGSRASAALDFSIVVLPSLQLRVSAPLPEALAQRPFIPDAEAYARVRVEGNSGSISFHSTVTGPEGVNGLAMTLPAHHKLVRADSRWTQSLRHAHPGFGRNGGVLYTVAQL